MSHAILAERASEAKLQAAVDKKLRRHNLLRVFTVSTSEVQHENKNARQVHLSFNRAEWERRRRFDGMSLLVCHPDSDASPEQLCHRYRAKDTVEKDFQTIKSVIRMLPVRHWTDPKVLAHVTICALALLLERWLRDHLDGSMSAEIALEFLSTCHLNRYGEDPEQRAYLVTMPDEVQSRLLRQLDMNHLVDDDQMMLSDQPQQQEPLRGVCLRHGGCPLSRGGAPGGRPASGPRSSVIR